MKKKIINQREKIRNIKILRPGRLSCQAHQYHFKKIKN